MIDTNALLQKVDLARLIESNLQKPGLKKGSWLFWNCPFHAADQTPSLGIKPGDQHWYCFGCSKGGNAITWLMEFQRLSFKEACECLNTCSNAPANTPVSSAIMTNPPERSRPDALQEPWREVIKQCQAMLWQSEGSQARDYLHARGLKDSTLKDPFFQVGYSPGKKIGNVWVERGIVLPCFTTTSRMDIEYINYIKIRRPSGEPKYLKLPGHGAKLSGLFGADWISGAEVVFIAEGEFDSLLLHQEAFKEVGVCTLGGAGERFDFAAFGKYLLSAKHLFVAYDNDSAGQKGAGTWAGVSKRVHTVQVPFGKDITEFWQHGGDLSTWVMDVLRDYPVKPNYKITNNEDLPP
jgi:DNA primase